jgi:hypothetical protein
MAGKKASQLDLRIKKEKKKDSTQSELFWGVEWRTSILFMRKTKQNRKKNTNAEEKNSPLLPLMDDDWHMEMDKLVMYIQNERRPRCFICTTTSTIIIRERGPLSPNKHTKQFSHNFAFWFLMWAIFPLISFG